MCDFWYCISAFVWYIQQVVCAGLCIVTVWYIQQVVCAGLCIVTVWYRVDNA